MQCTLPIARPCHRATGKGNGPAASVFTKPPTDLSLPKMLSGANAFEISDIESMNIRAHSGINLWKVTRREALERGNESERDDSCGKWHRNSKSAGRRFRTRNQRSALTDGSPACIYDAPSPRGTRLRRSRDATAAEADLTAADRARHGSRFRESVCDPFGFGEAFVLSRARFRKECELGLPGDDLLHAT